MGLTPPSAMQNAAMEKVRDYIESKLEKTDPKPDYIVFVVWFTKVLQNWKAMVSTTLPDGMYYEVTYNGDKNETYIDAYKKFDNVAIPDETPDPATPLPGLEKIDRNKHPLLFEDLTHLMANKAS